MSHRQVSRRSVLASLAASTLLGPAARCLGADADEEEPLSRIAFGSDARQDRPQPIWHGVIAARPELMISLGNMIMSPTEELRTMKLQYLRLLVRDPFRDARKKFPMVATWNDLDYGKLDGGREFAMKEDVQDVFLSFWGEPKDSPRREQEGVYTSRMYGPPGKRVQVILLDTRYHRSPLRRAEQPIIGWGPYLPNENPEATILGEAQWKWLEGVLQEPAELRLLCSSNQIVPKFHGYEAWANFPHERERLLELIRTSGAAGVICLSGGIRYGEISRLDGEMDYPLWEVTSSGLNVRNRDIGQNMHRVGDAYNDPNFGLLSIDWQQEDPEIRLEVRDDISRARLEQTIRLSELAPQ